jgi:hypothetical protein
MAFFSVLILLFSCNEKTAQPDHSVLIKGDWIGELDTITDDRNETNYMSFDDSTCYGLYWAHSNYQLQKDTLNIKNLTDYEKGRISRYTILQLTTDSLTLLAAKHDSDRHIPDTIILSRIKAKNNISPSAIYFASSGCFGSCPITYLEIDSSLNVKFYGLSFTAVMGGYSGTISRSEYNAILDKVRNISLNTLKPWYQAPWTDDETCGVAIVQGDSVIRTAAYGHYREPMELNLLLNKLEDAYKRMQLHPDSMVTPKYFSDHSPEALLDSLVFPPPAPMPEFTMPKIKD